MAGKDIFRTQEGSFRILVTQIIDGREVDWFLVERRDLVTPDKLVAHMQAVERFVGTKVEFVAESGVGGYTFTVKDRPEKVAG